MSVGDGAVGGRPESASDDGADDLGDDFFDVNGSVELPCGFAAWRVVVSGARIAARTLAPELRIGRRCLRDGGGHRVPWGCAGC